VDVAEPPTCGLCKGPMSLLPRRTGRKDDEIWVCATGKDEHRPCDGGLWAVATKSGEAPT
jgi:hypothetical protein